ncbi:cupin domain-containing protein [Halobacillus yeomjeoni]|uniref:cupin domain-containing protein n=1 Tax=Halobacillus yeomjeoni TaxID=311194 RepID=UPI001CD2A879|nr:cupin domain-containing protein [Halobacillus yeomjeoni]MCA0984086.1 cupin domain-containing protein [Halobacillus yeomjeoni]
MNFVPQYYPYLYQHPQSAPISYYRNPSVYWTAPYQAMHPNGFDYYRSSNMQGDLTLTDYGQDPFVMNINEATLQNDTFRTALWTGEYLQITLMSIGVGEDIGLEIHPDLDQFLRIEQGEGVVEMGENKNELNYVREVYDDDAIVIPAGTWHNLTNTGDVPLKLYSIYAPPNHPFGTVHPTKADAEAAEKGY